MGAGGQPGPPHSSWARPHPRPRPHGVWAPGGSPPGGLRTPEVSRSFIYGGKDFPRFRRYFPCRISETKNSRKHGLGAMAGWSSRSGIDPSIPSEPRREGGRSGRGRRRGVRERRSWLGGAPKMAGILTGVRRPTEMSMTMLACTRLRGSIPWAGTMYTTRCISPYSRMTGGWPETTGYRQVSGGELRCMWGRGKERERRRL